MEYEPTFCPFCGAAELGEYSGEVTWVCCTTSWDDATHRSVECIYREREQRLVSVMQEGIDLTTTVHDEDRSDWGHRASLLLAELGKFNHETREN